VNKVLTQKVFIKNIVKMNDIKFFVRLIREIDNSIGTNEKKLCIKKSLTESLALNSNKKNLDLSSSLSVSWIIFFLAGGKIKGAVSTKTLKAVITEVSGLSEWLVEESYYNVGDLGETAALLCAVAFLEKEKTLVTDSSEPINSFVAKLHSLKEMNSSEKLVFLKKILKEKNYYFVFTIYKLFTGSFRLGVSKSMVIQVLSELSGKTKEEVATNIVLFMNNPEERIIFLKWLFKDKLKSIHNDISKFEKKIFPFPFFLAQTANASILKSFENTDNFNEWCFEWKWDGVRCQIVSNQHEKNSCCSDVTMWSRGEEFLTSKFPEIVNTLQKFLAPGIILDGELLFWNYLSDEPMSFSFIQSRIQRSHTKINYEHIPSCEPIFMAYDILRLEAKDIREIPFIDRRRKLVSTLIKGKKTLPKNIKISPLIPVKSIEIAQKKIAEARSMKTEGLMIKRKLGKYNIGRVKGSSVGDCWKWKVNPYCADAVLIYAQKGHGRRSGLYSDYTLGIWNDELKPAELVPFAKAYSGLSQSDIKLLNTKIRGCIEEKFGPVKKLKPQIVLEVSFEGIMFSKRHKSGISVRFPRLKRIRFDKRPEDADKLSTLKKLI
tara:strand:+ start:25334 stop:27145 length:1812 start_codon:yes stop_codon:yes gene_type:complete